MIKKLKKEIGRALDPNNYLRQLRQHRRRELTRRLSKLAENRVLYGPFEGLCFASMGVWGDDVAAIILGRYEQQIMAVLEEQIAKGRGFERIVNVGSADGFYAVGLARSFGAAEVITVDPLEGAKAAFTSLARLNKLEVTHSHLDSIPVNDFRSLWSDGKPSLFLVDCEGYEEELFARPLNPAEGNMLIVETHDIPGRERFAMTAEAIRGVEPTAECRTFHVDASYIAEMPGLDFTDRALLLDEGRGQGEFNGFRIWVN